MLTPIQGCNRQTEEEPVGFIRIAAPHAGGITHARRIVDLAALHDMRTGFHGAPRHSPICMAAHAHLNACAPGFGIREYLLLGTPECDALFASEHRMRNDMVHVGDAPGLGVELDESEAARHGYRAASRPILRLGDGAVWTCRSKRPSRDAAHVPFWIGRSYGRMMTPVDRSSGDAGSFPVLLRKGSRMPGLARQRL